MVGSSFRSWTNRGLNSRVCSFHLSFLPLRILRDPGPDSVYSESKDLCGRYTRISLNRLIKIINQVFLDKYAYLICESVKHMNLHKWSLSINKLIILFDAIFSNMHNTQYIRITYVVIERWKLFESFHRK